MIVAAVIQQASLADAPPASVIGAAVNWITGLLFGPLATVIAVIAVAWIGFAMLSGRVDIRRGMTVLLGCFLLFGAKDIADGLQSATSNQAFSVAATVPPPPVFRSSTSNLQNAEPHERGGNVFDPYAGASVIKN